jgi:hypothetical protein
VVARRLLSNVRLNSVDVSFIAPALGCFFRCFGSPIVSIRC